MTDSNTELLAALVKEVNRIANAIEAIASVQAPAPAITRPMADWAKARDILEGLGAEVVAEDKSGPTRAQYQGRIYVRRSAHDEDGEKGDAIWFSCVLSGSVKESNVKWGRLLTFRDRKTDTLPNGAKKLKVEAPEQKPQMTEKPHAAPAKSPAQAQATVKWVWPAATIKLALKWGVVRTGNEAAELLDRSGLGVKDPEDIVIKWCLAYVQALRDGETPEQALFLADTTLPKENRNGGSNGSKG